MSQTDTPNTGSIPFRGEESNSIASPMTQRESVAIIGISGVFPQANSVSEFWSNIELGKNCLTELEAGIAPRTSASSKRSANGADKVHVATGLEDIDQFDATFFDLPPREARLLDPQQRMLLQQSWAAIENAGYDPLALPGTVGVYAGVNLNTYFIHNILGNGKERRRITNAQVATLCEKDYVSARLSYQLNLKGPSVTVQNACATSLTAIHLACESLLNMESDMALAAAASITLPENQGYDYQPDSILSPDGKCRSFSAHCNGTVYSSGVGVVLLKRLSDAIESKDTIHALIKSTSVNNDGNEKMNFTSPSELGQTQCIKDALALAQIQPHEIHYVEGHGTGTKLGDAIEVAALNKAYLCLQEGLDKPRLGSVKSNIGHAQNAAGMAGLFKCLYVLKERVIPAMPEHSVAGDPVASSSLVINATCEAATDSSGPLRAAVSAISLGGSNAHIILEEAPAVDEPKTGVSGPRIVPFSAKSGPSLMRYLDRFQHYLTRSEGQRADLCRIAQTLQSGRHSFDVRAAVVASNCDELRQKIEVARSNLLLPNQGIHDESVVFVFPGLGEFGANTGRGIYADSGIYRTFFEDYLSLTRETIGLDLSSCFEYLPDSPTLSMSREHLWKRPSVAYPAIFCVEYALAKTMMAYGIHPDVVLGYSVGEYVAACVAEVLTPHDAISLLYKRGEVIETLPEGGMLAVLLGENDVRPHLSGSLTISAVNTRKTCVVSGGREELELLRQTLLDQSVAAMRVEADYAFHSPLMSSVLDPFRKIVKQISLRDPVIPFVSSMSGEFMGPGELTSEFFVRHVIDPVRFLDGVACLNHEQRCFIELGGAGGLTSFILQDTAIETDRLKQPEHFAVSLTPKSNDCIDDAEHFNQTLGQLWVRGHNLDWNLVNDDSREQKVALPTYCFDTGSYWIEPDNIGELDGVLGEHTAAERADRQAGGMHPDDHGCIEDASVKAPVTSQELNAVLVIWQDVLGHESISPDESFFELGGSSLLAIQICSDIRRCLNVEISLDEFYVASTCAGLNALVTKKQGEDNVAVDVPLAETSPIELNREARYEPFDLTDIQHAYWIGRQKGLVLGNIATHIYWEFDQQNLDVARFESAWNRLIERHDMLRMIIEPAGQQKVLANPGYYSIDVQDLRGRNATDVEAELASKREQLSHQVMDTGSWPLFGIHATQLNETVRIHVGIDLLIADAWSIMGILARELGELYKDTRAVMAPVPITFRDYVEAEARLEGSRQHRQAQAYWHERVDTLPAGPALPLVKDPQAIIKPEFVRREYQLEENAWQSLKAFCQKRALTPSVVLCTVYADVLRAWSKEARFTINVTLFNRLPLHPDVAQVVGDFTSLTLLEVDLARHTTFQEKATSVQRQLWKDMDHRHISGVEVIRNIAKRRSDTGQFQIPVVFTSIINQTPDQQTTFFDDISGLDSSTDGTVYTISQTPQVWLDHQIIESEGRLVLTWDSIDALFPDQMLEDMFKAYTNAIEHLAQSSAHWDQAFGSHIPQHQLITRERYNDTHRVIDARRLHTDTLETIAARGSHVAIKTPSLSIRYDELGITAAAVQRWLVEKSANPGDRVAIFMDKGWEQVPAVLACLATGCVYTPIAADSPEDRVQHILGEADIDCVITQPRYAKTLSHYHKGAVYCVDDVVANGPELQDTVVSGKDPAYLIYTSGSTGKPKGVLLSHDGANNTIKDVNERIQLCEHDTVFALSNLSFDLSVYDLFGPLSVGGTIALPDHGNLRNPEHWHELIMSASVTVWNSVPALMEMYTDYLNGARCTMSPLLRVALLSGDWVSIPLVQRVQQLSGDIRLFSLGGATEASIWSVIHEIDDETMPLGSIPYGCPLMNQQIHVFDDQLTPRPDWVTGELCIAGDGLALEYIGNRELTEKAFVCHPTTGQRLYRTGDIGRFHPTGYIEFLGRNDTQVKIGGHRIELGEIESALNAHPCVQNSAVLVNQDADRNIAQLTGVFSVSQSEQCVELCSSDNPDRNEGNAVQDGRIPLRTSPESHMDLSMLPSTVNDQTPLVAVLHDLLTPFLAVRIEGTVLPKYLYASAGSLYPVKVVVSITRRTSGATQYFYLDAIEGRLYALNDAAASTSRQVFGEVEIGVHLIALRKNMQLLYGQWTDDFVALEAGSIGQLMEQHLANLGLGYVKRYDDELPDALESLIVTGEAPSYLTTLVVQAESAQQERTGTSASITTGTRHSNRTNGIGTDQTFMPIPDNPLPMELQKTVLDPARRLQLKQERLDTAFMQRSDGIIQLTVSNHEELENHKSQVIARRSYRLFSSAGTDKGLTLEKLSDLLVQLTDMDCSTDVIGAQGPRLLIYLYIKEGRVSEIPHGVYRFDSVDMALHRMGQKKLYPSCFSAGENEQTFAAGAFAVFFVSAQTCASAANELFGSELRAGLYYDVGRMCGVFEQHAPAIGVGCCQIGSVEGENIQEVLNLTAGQRLLHCVVGGPIDEDMKTVSSYQRDVMSTTALMDTVVYSPVPLEIQPSDLGSFEPSYARHREKNVHRRLSEVLPHYMVPRRLMCIDHMPLTENGKVDRKALTHHVSLGAATHDDTPVMPQSVFESDVCSVIQSVLELESVGTNENFFDLGGNSVHLVKIQARLNHMVNVPLSIADLFEHTNVYQLCRYIETQNHASANVISTAPGGRSEDLDRGKKRKRTRVSTSRKTFHVDTGI